MLTTRDICKIMGLTYDAVSSRLKSRKIKPDAKDGQINLYNEDIVDRLAEMRRGKKIDGSSPLRERKEKTPETFWRVGVRNDGENQFKILNAGLTLRKALEFAATYKTEYDNVAVIC